MMIMMNFIQSQRNENVNEMKLNGLDWIGLEWKGKERVKSLDFTMQRFHERFIFSSIIILWWLHFA